MGNSPPCGASTVIMSSVSDRAVGAIVGSFIADAATLPVHWVYDQSVLAEAASKQPVPEFLPQSICPFYCLETGKNSAYCDQLFALLQSMVENKGFNKKAYTEKLVKSFGPGSPYDYEKVGKPVKGPWLAGTMKKFLANAAAGKEDTGDTGSHDGDGMVNCAVVVALNSGADNMTAKVEEVVSVTQNNPQCKKYSVAAAKLLEGYILNGPNPNALEDLKGQVDAEIAGGIDKVLGMKGDGHNAAAQKLGLPCPLPGVFLSALHCVAISKSNNFVESVRPTLLAGGDNCPRAAFVGACLGAQVGVEGLPADLLAKVHRGEEVKKLAKQLVEMHQ